MVERLLLPQIEQTWGELILVTQIRDRHRVGQMAAQDRGLLLRREHAPRAGNGFLRGTHDYLRCSIVWSGGCPISTGAGQYGMILLKWATCTRVFLLPIAEQPNAK